MEQSVVSPSLEVIVLWYDSSNKLIGNDELTNIQATAEFPTSSSGSVDVLNNSYKERIKFTYLNKAKVENNLV